MTQLQSGSLLSQTYWLEAMKAAKVAGAAVGRRQVQDTRSILAISEGSNDPVRDSSREVHEVINNRPGKRARIHQPQEQGKRQALGRLDVE